MANFIYPESDVRVIFTASRLIVLEREVGSMAEFKQIVGRGASVHEDSTKYYCTLIDFRNVTKYFAAPL